MNKQTSNYINTAKGEPKQKNFRMDLCSFQKEIQPSVKNRTVTALKMRRIQTIQIHDFGWSAVTQRDAGWSVVKSGMQDGV